MPDPAPEESIPAMSQVQHAQPMATRGQSRAGEDAEPRLPALLRFFYDHEVSSAMLLLFALSLFGQSLTGYWGQLSGAHAHLATYLQYLASGDFLETVAENWEGEFLPLAAYLFFTSWLHERGAKESRKPGKRDGEKTDSVPPPEAARRRQDAPWPLKVGGPIRWIYLHSIFFAFLLIFLLAVTVHAIAGLGGYNDALAAQHLRPASIFQYMASDTFWLQSTRNWEAGFFSTAMLAVFSIFLRQRGSPVSKQPAQPNNATAEENEKDEKSG